MFGIRLFLLMPLKYENTRAKKHFWTFEWNSIFSFCRFVVHSICFPVAIHFPNNTIDNLLHTEDLLSNSYFKMNLFIECHDQYIHPIVPHVYSNKIWNFLDICPILSTFSVFVSIVFFFSFLLSSLHFVSVKLLRLFLFKPTNG